MAQSRRDKGHDFELAQAAMARRRKRGPAAKSEFRKWMELHEPALRAQIEAGQMSWVGLEDWFWENGYRTLEGTRIGPGVIQAAWTRIQRSRALTESHYTLKRQDRGSGSKITSGVAGTARIGKAQPLSEAPPFTLKTLGDKDKSKK